MLFRLQQALRGAIAALVVLLLVLLPSPPAQAFCGFYVSGADAKLFNNATIVVMMREGTRTVLSMQNNYQGPPENFAMVVPVPQVLQEDNVKILPRALFDRIDQLAAPRLVEYWEQDPCGAGRLGRGLGRAAAPMRKRAMTSDSAAAELGVKVEAEFTVGEYEVVILSASNSAGLDTWLKQEGYKIPANAEPYLRPYVQQGMNFFVAKVDISKVTMGETGAELSPLRFHYEDKQFRLPVRLGLINSQGKQDLLVHILARGQRYSVANYENVTIPTNINVRKSTLSEFGPFYAALFDETLAKNKGAVVTEYAWDSSTCDPCPVPALRPNELATFGADVLPAPGQDEPVKSGSGNRPTPQQAGRAPTRPRRQLGRRPWRSGFVLTRLHARYDSDALGEDLIFQKAEAIAGGREYPQKDGKPVYGSTKSSINQFQARYAVRHSWAGEVNCDQPRYGRWGGPPGGKRPSKARAATDLAFAKRGGVQLASMVRQAVPEIGVKPVKPGKGKAAPAKAGDSAKPGASGNATSPAPASSSSSSSSSSGDGEASSPPAASSCACHTPGQRRPRPHAACLMALLFGVCCWWRRH